MTDPATPRTLFMLVRTTPEWLALPPPERFAFVEGVMKPLLAAHPEVRLRFFDTEAYNARVSDVLMWETRALDRWDSLVEGLRETPFWGRFFEVLEILPGVEDGYARHYEKAPVNA